MLLHAPVEWSLLLLLLLLYSIISYTMVYYGIYMVYGTMVWYYGIP